MMRVKILHQFNDNECAHEADLDDHHRQHDEAVVRVHGRFHGLNFFSDHRSVAHLVSSPGTVRLSS